MTTAKVIIVQTAVNTTLVRSEARSMWARRYAVASNVRRAAITSTNTSRLTVTGDDCSGRLDVRR